MYLRMYIQYMLKINSPVTNNVALSFLQLLSNEPLRWYHILDHCSWRWRKRRRSFVALNAHKLTYILHFKDIHKAHSNIHASTQTSLNWFRIMWNFNGCLPYTAVDSISVLVAHWVLITDICYWLTLTWLPAIQYIPYLQAAVCVCRLLAPLTVTATTSSLATKQLLRNTNY